MDSYQTYYIYYHIDPVTKEIVYIGCGLKSRAWSCGTYRSDSYYKQYGNRNSDHNDWMESLLSKGYLPCDWVKIKFKGLSKEDVYSLEKKLIYKHQPLFNKNHNIKYKSVARDVIKINKAKKLRKEGLYYSAIAKEIGVSSHMTAWRYVNEY